MAGHKQIQINQNSQQLKDILKDQWTPALTIKTAMLSLQALLCSPEPNDPQGMYLYSVMNLTL